ncbi:MAG: hypothetical protein U0174_17905 [Polyangiaceae bacterium]
MGLQPNLRSPSSVRSISAGRRAVLSIATLSVAGLFLAGCPIFGNDRYYDDNSSGGSSSGNTRRCTAPSQCGTGEVCASNGVCMSGSCDTLGCVSPYSCVVEQGVASCKIPTVTDAGVKTDAKADADSGFSGCRKDSECTALGAGAKCLTGTCTARPDQCSDATQCRSAEQCVDGVCTPSCNASKPCPTGFACDLTKGVCTGNPSPCGNGPACSAGTTCVQEHCVAPCVAGACQNGLVCVDGGCFPEQRPIFSCTVDGEVGTGGAGKCAIGSICLRRSCYIACTPSDPDACKNADQFDQCKEVTTSSGPHNVCGSSTNLGSECDPASGKACTDGTKICIDGFCR